MCESTGRVGSNGTCGKDDIAGGSTLGASSTMLTDASGTCEDPVIAVTAVAVGAPASLTPTGTTTPLEGNVSVEVTWERGNTCWAETRRVVLDLRRTTELFTIGNNGIES